jgi:transposase-like protein
MPRKRFTNEQIAFALRQAENGATVDEVCRKMGVSEPTFYRWKKQFVGMGVCRRSDGSSRWRTRTASSSGWSPT